MRAKSDSRLGHDLRTFCLKVAHLIEATAVDTVTQARLESQLAITGLSCRQ